MLFFCFQTLTYITGLLKAPRSCVLILLAFFVIYFGFSFANGNDWIGYFSNYDCLINNICRNKYLKFEIGFNALTNSFGRIGGFPLITFVVTMINAISILWFSKKFKYPSYAFMMIVGLNAWHIYMELSRQSIAQSILLFSVFALLRRRYLYFFMLTGAACLFHSSALIVLILPFIGASTKSFKYSSILLTVSAFIFMLFPIELLLFLSRIFGNINPMIQEKLSYYIVAAEYVPKLTVGLGTINDLFIILAPIYLIIKWKNNEYTARIIKSGSLLFCIILIITKMHPVMLRLSFYFIPYMTILLSQLFGGMIDEFKLDYKDFKYFKTIKTMFIVGIILQGMVRPFMYDHLKSAIINYENIISQSIVNPISDNTFREKMILRCNELHTLGYNEMCSLRDLSL